MALNGSVINVAWIRKGVERIVRGSRHSPEIFFVGGAEETNDKSPSHNNRLSRRDLKQASPGYEVWVLQS